MRPRQSRFSPASARSTLDLPEPDFADDAEALAFADRERDALHGLEPAEADMQILDRDHDAAQAGSRTRTGRRRRGRLRLGRQASRPCV